jgi:PHD/YefM family antitoxin component YafN of YafNO toxin-antitoxin module
MVATSANELKTRGIAAIESALADQREATISVRGKNRYVVMPLEQFHYLRECELEAALAQTRRELATGSAVREGAEAHVERMEREDEE